MISEGTKSHHLTMNNSVTSGTWDDILKFSFKDSKVIGNEFNYIGLGT